MNKILRIFTVSIIAGFLFYGCKNWEYDVLKNGIHFSKIHQSKGGTYVGYMTENHNIQGFPCEKGWIHFRKDWQLLSFQLSKNVMYKSTLLPSSTWLHFPYHNDHTGYVCSFPDDKKVQGYLCGGSGGYKGTHTGFYENGKLRSFFPPEDVLVNGVPCEAGLLVNVKLHENGNIKSCRLAEDYQVDGKTYQRHKTIAFDKTGKVNMTAIPMRDS